MVEVIVAMGLLSVGALGIAAGGLLATRLLRAAETEEELSNRAIGLLDSVITNGVNGTGTVQTARYRLDWTAGTDSAAVTIHTADSATFTLRALR